MLLGCSSGNDAAAVSRFPTVPPPVLVTLEEPATYDSLMPVLNLIAPAVGCEARAEQFGLNFAQVIDIMSSNSTERLAGQVSGWYTVGPNRFWATVSEERVRSGADPAFYLSAVADTAALWDLKHGQTGCAGSDQFWKTFTGTLSDSQRNYVDSSVSFRSENSKGTKAMEVFQALVHSFAQSKTK